MLDSDLLQFAMDFRAAIIGDKDSAWMCAAISGPLCAALEVKGVSCQLMESDLGECNHVFIQLQDGRILDPTADQFNWCSANPLPGVYLGPEKIIHADAVPSQHAECWKPLLREFKRLAPQYLAREVGTMVRSALATLPTGICELPN